MHYIHAVPTILAMLAFGYLGFLVIHNRRTFVNKLFVTLLVVDSVWLFSVFLVNFTSLESHAYLSRLVFSASVGLLVSMLAFINELLGLQAGKLYKLLMYGSGLVLIGVTALTNFIIRGVHTQVVASHSSPFPTYGTFYPLFLLYVTISAGSLLYILFRRPRPSAGRSVTTEQLYVVRLAIVLFVLSNLLTNLILPAIASDARSSQLMPVGSVLLAVLFFYAIGRHRLFDVQFFVVRVAGYLTTLFVMTFLIVAPVIWIFGRFLSFHPSTEQFVTVVFWSVVALYLLQYLRRIFDKLTVLLFFRHYYDPQEVLNSLSGVLVGTADLTVLYNETAEILREALKPNFLRYVLFADKSEENAELAKKIVAYCPPDAPTMLEESGLSAISDQLAALFKTEKIAIAVKLRTTHEDMGYLILGYKRSGDAYSVKDKRLLSVAADEIAIAIQNVLRFEEIQHFNRTLQGKVEDATRKLRRTNERLRMLDETKDDFISLASHQLRTPLTAVKGYISLVLDGDAGPIKPSQRRLLEQAFTSSQRMVYLIADLLNVSRLRTGKFVIESSPVNLADIVQEEVTQLTETAQSRSLTLTYNKPKYFPALSLDETKTRQVVMNFIDNAIYYTPAGGHIEVKLTETSHAAELRVIDNGIGVPSTERHHLFTKFYRAQNAQRARPDGTGLGLFMAQKVIASQGGSIIFHSTENKGSTFGFSFPKDGAHNVPDTAVI